VKVLITGANGFVGRALCSHLAEAGIAVRAAVRAAAPDVVGVVVVGDIDGATDWSRSLDGITHVVHLAGRAHVLRETAQEAEAAFRAVNFEGTRRLAEEAAARGVRRVVFVSSVKACAESTSGPPLTEQSTPHPEDAYGRSKLDAERTLLRIAGSTNLEVAILRPPLVYGPDVQANFLRLMQLVDRAVPLPLGSVRNRRSLVYRGNLASAIECCLTHPAAAGETFFVSDGEDVSTPELIRRLAVAMDRPTHLWPMPVRLLRIAARLAGMDSQVGRLVDSLVVDSARIRTVLGWTPPFNLDQGLRHTAEWYRSAGART